MIHPNLPRNCVVFLILCELTRLAIYGSQKLDSHKWLTVLVDEVKGKPYNFEACLFGSLYSTFTTSFQPYALYNKRLDPLFKDQLDRSKAMCSFNTLNYLMFAKQWLETHETWVLYYLSSIKYTLYKTKNWLFYISNKSWTCNMMSTDMRKCRNVRQSKHFLLKDNGLFGSNFNNAF